MIAIDINLANKKYRGIGSYVYNLAKSLKGGNIPILYIGGPGTSPEFRRDIYIPFFESTIRLLIIPGVLSKARIFHGPSHLGIPLFRAKNVKYISTIHDLVPIYYKGLVNFKYRLIASIFLRNSVFSSDKIITISHSVKEEIIQIFKISPEKIKVIYLGPTLPYKIIDIKKKYGLTHYFLSHMPDDPRKNAKNIIKAFLKVSKRIKNIELVFTGRATHIQKEDFPPNIRFLGFVPDDELFSLYKEAVALVFPSFYEGFGFPVLDAFTTCTPVITSSIGASREIGVDGAILVDPHSSEEIEDAMVGILTNKKQRDILKRKGVKRAQKFSWEKTSQKTIEVYKGLL